jgi:hypothetical protein
MKHLFTLILVFTSILLTAQETTEETTKKKFSFEGSVDAYYRTNLTAPNDQDQIAPGTSFADTSWRSCRFSIWSSWRSC